MRRYRCTDYVAFGEGTILHLSEEQIRRRAHLLEESVEGRCMVKLRKAPFFTDEIVGIEGSPPASTLRHLECLDEEDSKDAPLPPSWRPEEELGSETLEPDPFMEGQDLPPGNFQEKEPQNEDDRFTAIRSAVRLLGEDGLDAKKRPKVSDVSKTAGFKTTRAEIDAALSDNEIPEEDFS